MNELKKAQLIQAAKRMRSNPMAPDRYCKNCGEDLSEYCRDSRYVIAPGVTLCPECFFWRFLKGGNN